MGIANCIGAALQRGAITAEEADYLRTRAASYDDMDKDAFARGIREEGALRRVRAQMTEVKRSQMWTDMTQMVLHKGVSIQRAAASLFEHFGDAGFASVRALQGAIHSEALANIERSASEFRTRFGLIPGKAFTAEDDIARAGFGQNVNDAAKSMYAGWRHEAERLRDAMVSAGGDIRQRADWAFPQSHSASALANVGFKRWHDFINPRLDWDKIIDPVSGAKVPLARREAALQHVFEGIVTDGASTRTPDGARLGVSLGNRRAYARFLHFKDADGWLSYNKEFGSGGVHATMMAHIEGMSRDLAYMQRFGPDPGSSVEWLKQVVSREAGRFAVDAPTMWGHGLKSEAAGKQEAMAQAAKFGKVLDAFHEQAQGFGDAHNNFAHMIDMGLDIEASAKLGSAFVNHALTNPILSAMGRYLDGAPILKSYTDLMKGMKPGEAERAGLMLQEGLRTFERGARQQGMFLKMRSVTRMLPKITTAISGLDAVARASRRSAYLGQMDLYGSHAHLAFDDLPDRVRETMQGGGINAETWDVLRPYAQDGSLNPADVKDGPARLAYSAHLHQRAEVWAPMSNWSTQASAKAFAGQTPNGRAFMRAVLQFKGGFMATVMLTQLRQMQAELSRYGATSAAGYGLASAAALTLGGMAILQAKQVFSGKTPLAMDMSPHGLETWGRAALTSGALGIYGDFLASDLSSYGHKLGPTLLGPLGTGLDDAGSAAIKMGLDAAKGKPSLAPLVPLLRYNMPVLSTHWALRAAYQRVLMDQLQYMADPKAHQKWSAAERRLMLQTGQKYLYPPGGGLY